ncbi:MAG TPA: hypothetical protein VLF88_00590 [Candidatus Babeliales bacterium]|nr:hypothetical protein [Candidatus Babeliales bacterium]
MAKIRSEFNSQFRDVPAVQEDPAHLFAHNIHNGDFLFARCLGDERGADIYVFEGLNRDEEWIRENLGSLIIPKNVATHLLPWFDSEKFPYTSDSGEPGEIVFRHRPDIFFTWFHPVYFED